MANYNIYVLGEDEIDISGGGQLDGVTQGDGSHLEGLSITLLSSAWQPVAVRDNDDDFSDNDTSQRLDGDQLVNGVPYDDGAVVEAEYGITVTDGTNTWTMVGFNVRDSPKSYATVEGLAFISAPQGPPPVGTPLLVTSAFEFPSFAVADYDQPVCFVTGTTIRTPDGPVPVERIQPGMSVLTRDHGTREVLWTGHRRVVGAGSFAPVHIPAGALGNRRSVRVSPQHLVLVSDDRASVLFGERDVFVPAKHLVGLAGIERVVMGPMGYHHLLLSEHAAVAASGLWSESFRLGPQAEKCLRPHAREEVLTRFPELRGRQSCYRVVKSFEAEVLKKMA